MTTRKRTAIQAFRKYGRPRRIRSDHGGENALVWRDMNSTWGEDARPVIVGSSVHDQRIGRHYRSANKQELSILKSEFYDLKRDGVVDPLNETDLFCLHHVCLPRLNKNGRFYTRDALPVSRTSFGKHFVTRPVIRL